MKRWKLATARVIQAKSSGRNKLQQTVKFVAAIDDMERFVSIMTGAITSLPSPGVTSEEIEIQLSDLEVINPVEKTAEKYMFHEYMNNVILMTFSLYASFFPYTYQLFNISFIMYDFQLEFEG